MKDHELIIRYIKEEATPLERATLEKWLQESETNKILFAELRNAWDVSSKLDKPITFDKQAAWKSIQQKILQEQNDKPDGINGSLKRTWMLRIAATLIIALFATWFLLNRSESENLLTVQTNTTGKTIILSDCTRVFLNENSTLVYPEKFVSNERKVSLIGEAFFEVTKDTEHPFIIDNKDFDIKVLGTSFNVAAYNERERAVVTVVTGKVAMHGKEGNLVVLEKGEVGVLDKSRHQVNLLQNHDLNFLSWKTRKIEFKNAAFKDVCETLKNYFGTQVDVRDANILKCKFTGYFVDPSLEEVLKVLEKTLDIKTLITNKQVIVTGRGC